MPRSIKVGLATLTLSAVAGCMGGGYVYVPPVRTSYIPADLDEAETLVPYRMLVYSDFKADEPPPELVHQKDRLGAVTTIIIYAGGAVVDAVEIPSNPDSSRWEASVEGLVFEARMVPRRSWWNPKHTKGKDIRRILDHEQWHFAISELQARRENAHHDLQTKNGSDKKAQKDWSKRMARMIAESDSAGFWGDTEPQEKDE